MYKCYTKYRNQIVFFIMSIKTNSYYTFKVPNAVMRINYNFREFAMSYY